MKKKLALASLVFLLLSLGFVRTADCSSLANSSIVSQRPVQSFPICTVAGDQAIPQVAYNIANDEYLVVWGDYRALKENADLYVPGLIYGQRVSARGKLLGSEIPVSADNPEIMRIMPAVSYSPDHNEYLVVYCKNFDLYARFVNSDGTLRGDEIPICIADRFQMHPFIIYNPKQKNYLILWNDSRKGAGQADIYGIFMNKDGGFDTEEFLVCDVRDDQFLPVAAYNSTKDEFLLSWEDFRNCDLADCYLYDCSIYGRRMSSDGVFLSDEVPIAAHGHDNRQQRIVYNPNREEYFVSWNDRRNDPSGENTAEVQNVDLYGRRITGEGSILNDFPISTSPNSQSYSSIAYDPQSRMYLVVWNDYRDVIFDAQMLSPPIGTYGFNVLWDPGTIYAQWLDEEGNPAGNDFILCPQSQGYQSLAYLNFNDTKRRYFAVWSDERNAGGGKDIYGTLFQAPPQSPCPATALLGEGTTLNLLRRFRDTVLSRSDAMKNYSNRYYEHAEEVSAMLVADKSIRAQALEIIAEGMPVIRALAQGNQALLNRGLIRKIDGLLAKMSGKASDSLKRALAAMRTDIREKKIFTQCGCIIK